MFKFIRRIILLIIIGVVCIGGYFVFNYTKDLKGGELITNRVELEVSKIYTIDVYKLAVKTDAVINILPISSGESYVSYTLNKSLVDEFDFKVNVVDTKIDICTSKNNAYKMDKFEINIYCNYNKLILSSSVGINADASACSDLKVIYSGTKSLNITNVNVTTLDIKATSSGKMNISGTTTNLECNSSGSGDIEASSLTCDTANISLQGKASMIVRVNTTLNVNIGGSGGLTYYGNPAYTKEGSGAGVVSQVKE